MNHSKLYTSINLPVQQHHYSATFSFTKVDNERCLCTDSRKHDDGETIANDVHQVITAIDLTNATLADVFASLNQIPDDTETATSAVVFVTVERDCESNFYKKGFFYTGDTTAIKEMKPLNTLALYEKLMNKTLNQGLEQLQLDEVFTINIEIFY